MEGMSSMGPGMEGGMGMGMGYPGAGTGMYGGGYGGETSSDKYGESGSGMMGGYAGYGSEMGTSGAGYGEMGSGYGSTGMAAAVPTVDYALVRFHDFTAQPGRKYRYRVSVFYEDPNHPQMPTMEPNERTLDEEVKKRLAPVLADEKEKNSRVYYVRTDWSAPSPVIAIDPVATALAGSVELNRPVGIPGSEQTLPAEPRGKVMAVVWNDSYAVDVPGVVDASRGSVLDFTATANVIHPVTLQFRELPDFRFATGQSVLDLRGGEPLPGGDQLTSLGEYIVVGEDGRLAVHNELEDYDTFQLNTPPKAPLRPRAWAPVTAAKGESRRIPVCRRKQAADAGLVGDADRAAGQPKKRVQERMADLAIRSFFSLLGTLRRGSFNLGPVSQTAPVPVG